MILIEFFKNKKVRVFFYFVSIILLSFINYRIYKSSTWVTQKNIFSFIQFLISILLLIIIFAFKIKKIEKLFLLLGIIFGLSYLISMPFCKVPDENSHFARAYSISNGELISKTDDNNRANVLLPFKPTEIVKLDNYKDIYNSINNGEEELTFYSNTALYNFIIYIPQTIGILICKIFNFSPFLMIYIARLFNLICYLALIYYSIKLIPFFKEIILIIGLNPMAIQEGASLSPDALTISISIFLISYIFYLIKENRETVITKKQYIVLFFITLLCSLCKIVYLPLCLLCFLIPSSKFISKKDKIIKLMLVVGTSIVVNLIWLKIASRYLINFNPGVDSGNQIKYILLNPFEYIVIIYRTIRDNFGFWILDLFGYRLSIFNIYTGKFYSFITIILIVFLSFFNRFKNITIKRKTKFFIIFIFLSISLLIGTSLYVQWTPYKRHVIDGIQGRYFVPIVLLLPFLFLKVKDNKKNGNVDLNVFNNFIYIFLVFQNLNALLLIVMTYM